MTFAACSLLTVVLRAGSVCAWASVAWASTGASRRDFRAGTAVATSVFFVWTQSDLFLKCVLCVASSLWKNPRQRKCETSRSFPVRCTRIVMLQKTNLFVLAIAVAVVAGQAACPVYKGKECGGDQAVEVRGKEFTVKHGECRNGECECELGFSGPDCGTHGCLKNLQNCNEQHGTCIDEAYEFQNPDVLQSAKNAMTGIPRCQCKPGWTGPTCADRECTPACQHNGHCLNGVCHCTIGWAGSDCNTRACGPSTTLVTETDQDFDAKYVGQPLKGGCFNHGKCALPDGGMHHNAYCVCRPGYEGAFCDQLKQSNECASANALEACSGHGECVNKESNGQILHYCQCQPAWKGNDCNDAICPGNCSSAVLDSKGRFRGSCSPRLRRCTCAPGWTSHDCSVPDCPNTIRDYENGPADHFIVQCSGHGSCSNGVCACESGYAGAGCKDLACKNKCNGRGECTVNDVTNTSSCKCYQGYTGSFCTEKTSAACSGNGVGFDMDCDLTEGLCNMTTPRPEKQRCDCKAGFKGAKCEHQKCNVTSGEFAGKLCSGHGVCSPDYKCKCEGGFVGPLCGLRCPFGTNGKTCGGRGECVLDAGTKMPVCKCINTFTGPECATPVCPTGNNKQDGTLEQCSGLVQGKCVLDGNNSATCYCRDGYTGDNCAKLTCPADCSGHGRCNSEKGRCFCEHGYTGLDCASAACCDATCSGHGQCMEGSCQCKQEWYGMSCESKDPHVTHSLNCIKLHHCFKHGDCDEKNNKCICRTDEEGKPLWKGKFCQVPICKNDCSGNGECVYSVKGDRGVCQCRPGWFGGSCQKHGCPRDAQGSECSGLGQCVNGTCYCHPAWSGESCERKRCPKDCSGHGVCSTDGVCACLNGFTGDGCQNKACPGNGANGVQCSGHGHCNNGVCACIGFHASPFSTESQWSGSDCNTKTCPSGKYEGGKLVPGACSGRGTCRNQTCSCAEGYTGVGCEIETCKGWGEKRADGTYPFREAKCNNHGSCQTALGGKPKCQCNPGFSGDACEEKACEEPGCHEAEGQGKCVKGKCFCNTNFTGTFCEQIACKKCDPLHKCINDCHHQGTCNNGKCSCNAGFTGEDCGIQAMSFKHISTLIHSVTGKPCVSSCNSQCAVKPHASKVEENSCNWACRHKCVPKPSAGLRSQ